MVYDCVVNISKTCQTVINIKLPSLENSLGYVLFLAFVAVIELIEIYFDGL